MNAPLLEIEGASVMQGDALLLKDLTLRIEQGQHSAILGPNGSGKSTLVKLIARQLYPLYGGTVRIFGRSDWSVKELHALLGIVSPAAQRDYTSNERLEVFEAVASSFFSARGLWGAHDLTPDMRERSHRALAAAGVSHLVGREMSTLSTGEARRVLIARALVHRPKALLLDEPCSGLDPATRRRFLETLRDLARAGTTLLMVTHHVEEVLPETEHLILLSDGRLAAEGRKEKLMNAERLSALFDASIGVEARGAWYSSYLA